MRISADNRFACVASAAEHQPADRRCGDRGEKDTHLGFVDKAGIVEVGGW
jgi:hypothetical protein